ncbi:hypothetical protein AAFF_G00046910, partial [Aldrovandia affinis]
ERLETVDDFQREEQRLSDSEAFNALVLQLSRVGGKDLKDCVHKVLDRLFSNALLAKFNMKGKGNKGKLALEKTRCFGAVQAAVMKFSAEATEEALRQHAGDHIKHAPARRGVSVDEVQLSFNSFFFFFFGQEKKVSVDEVLLSFRKTRAGQTDIV